MGIKEYNNMIALFAKKAVCVSALSKLGFVDNSNGGFCESLLTFLFYFNGCGFIGMYEADVCDEETNYDINEIYNYLTN